MTDSSESGEGTVSSDLARILLRGASLGRQTMGELFEAAGMDPAAVQGSHRRISADQFNLLWSEMEKAAGDPNFGLHVGEAGQHFPGGHVLFAAMMNSARVGQALERFCRYHDLMADILRPKLVRQHDGAILRVAWFSPAMKPHRQHVECVASLVASILQQLAGRRFQGEVRFEHPRPADTSEHRRIFGPFVSFGQPGSEIFLSDAILDLSIGSADEDLVGILDRYAERVMVRLRRAKPWSTKVARAVNQSLCDGKPVIAEVAKRLGVSRRGLQSKLREEDATYQAILDEVRKGVATDALTESEMSVSEIAFLVGYSDQSAFHHAFKKWTGLAPLTFRDRQGR